MTIGMKFDRPKLGRYVRDICGHLEEADCEGLPGSE